ncbi:MAG: hypothetical protein ACF8XB_03490, partial [Planctomycetota bacterium JB042]
MGGGVGISVVVALAAAFAGDPPADLERVLADRDVQWELPGASPAAGGGGAGGSTPRAGRAWDDGMRTDPALPGRPAGRRGLLSLLLEHRAGRIFLVVLAVVGVVAMVVLLIQAWTGRGVGDAGGTRRGDGAGADRPSSGPEAPTWSGIEALAAAGEYEAAVHALLLRALHVLQHAARRSWPHAYTSREILARGRVDDRAREPLRL